MSYRSFNNGYKPIPYKPTYYQKPHLDDNETAKRSDP